MNGCLNKRIWGPIFNTRVSTQEAGVKKGRVRCRAEAGQEWGKSTSVWSSPFCLPYFGLMWCNVDPTVLLFTTPYPYTTLIHITEVAQNHFITISVVTYTGAEITKNRFVSHTWPWPHTVQFLLPEFLLCPSHLLHGNGLEQGHTLNLFGPIRIFLLEIWTWNIEDRDVQEITEAKSQKTYQRDSHF